MTWILGAIYVLASAFLLAALAGRVDVRIGRLIGARGSGVGSSRLGLLWARSLTRVVTGLRRRLRTRTDHSRIAAEVPSLLDVLSVSVTAGLSPRLALERVPDLLSGSLSAVLQTAKRDVALGTPWRRALETAGTKTGIGELRRLALVLDRAELLGSPIADRLRDLAAEVRQERKARREERAQRAPVQMLFPLVFLILPAFVLSAIVPALLVATRGIV